MKYLRIIGFLLLGIFSSCNNDEDNSVENLSGIYSEISPVKGRSQLNFINSNTVIKSELSSSVEDEFTYEIIGNIIKLKPTWDNSTIQKFEIEILNNSKFDIENLYADIGTNPTSRMTFEK